MPCAFPRAKNGMQWDELGRVPIADIARHRRDRERQNPENSRDRESKSLPLINADNTDQERNRDIGKSGHRKTQAPTAEGGGATRGIGDRERKRKPPAGGQAVFDLNIVHSRRRGRYAPKSILSVDPAQPDRMSDPGNCQHISRNAIVDAVSV